MDIEDMDITMFLPEVDNSPTISSLSSLPERSRVIYEKTYAEFMSWSQENQVTNYTESVLLAYFSEIARRGLIGSLWPKYSMLKATLILKDNIDISTFHKVIAFIKSQKEGYTPKKSKVLEKDQIQRFITDAPDNIFLITKIAMIFGVAGALRKEELLKLEIDDVQDLGSKFLVTIKSKTKSNKIFTIIDNEEKTLLNLIRHYMSLRPAHTTHKRFFIFYRDNKCSTQPVGINTFSKLPSRIAGFLKLDQPNLYTGHCFRRSSSSTPILSDAGADLANIKRHSAKRPTSMVEGYIGDSIQNKIRETGNSNGTSKRNDYINWDEYFMATAFLAAKRSKDPNTQVGACIVNEDKKIIGVGYNGMPNGCPDDEFPWSKQSEDPLENKYLYVCHAEMNAIVNKNTTDVKNCTMYVALFPCNECAKFIIQSGIKEVIYMSDKYAHKLGTIASKRMFDASGVKYRAFVPSVTKIEIDFNEINWGNLNQEPPTPVRGNTTPERKVFD